MMNEKQKKQAFEKLKKAIELVGGQTALARICGVQQSTVFGWKRAPAERAIQIEKATNAKVTRYELRPDLYPKD